MVDRQAAVLGLPDDREMVIGLDADHSAICKFGEDGEDFRPVWQSIRRLIRDSTAKVQREKEMLKTSVPGQVDSKAGMVEELSGE